MQDTYDKHKRAFPSVSAYVIVKDGKQVGKVAIKYGARLQAYVHLHGAPMSYGSAGGGGYDKTSAAIIEAIERHSRDAYAPDLARIDAIKAAFKSGDERHWDSILRSAGFDVWLAL